MNALPIQFLMLIFSGWVNRHQQDVIEYLQEENRALGGQLGGKQLRFTDQQRRRLAAKAKKVGRKGLFQIETLVSRNVDPRHQPRMACLKQRTPPT
jgi:hypothetical protein